MVVRLSGIRLTESYGGNYNIRWSPLPPPFSPPILRVSAVGLDLDRYRLRSGIQSLQQRLRFTHRPGPLSTLGGLVGRVGLDVWLRMWLWSSRGLQLDLLGILCMLGRWRRRKELRGVSSCNRRTWHKSIGNDVGRRCCHHHAVVRTRCRRLGNPNCRNGYRNPQFLYDSELTESFFHDGEPLPPDLHGFWSARNTRVFLNAQSVPELAPMGVGILVEGGLPGAQLDDYCGDSFV